MERIVFQWVPGHCGLVRNKKADQNAKRHFNLIKNTDPQYHERTPSSLRTITSYYKERLATNWKGTVPLITHRGSIAEARPTNHKSENANLTREDEVILAQLRTGYCKLLGSGLSYVTRGVSEPMQCRWCDRGEENVIHLFDGHGRDQRIQEQRTMYLARYGTQITSTHLYTQPSHTLEFFRGILAPLSP